MIGPEGVAMASEALSRQTCASEGSDVTVELPLRRYAGIKSRGRTKPKSAEEIATDVLSFVRVREFKVAAPRAS